jgi:hypothetical protein
VFKTAPAFRLTQLEERFAKLAAEVSALRTAAETVAAPAPTQLQNDLKNLKDSTEQSRQLRVQESIEQRRPQRKAESTELQFCSTSVWVGFRDRSRLSQALRRVPEHIKSSATSLQFF